MTKEEAILKAKAVAQEAGWVWKEPVSAVKRKKWLIGKSYWSITSNSESKGMNARILIDDSTGRILRSNFAER